MKKEEISNEWVAVSVPPPDEELLVRDCDGREAVAQPCWYPFTIKKRSSRKYDFEVVPCEPYMEGWMVRCNGLDAPELGEITHYKRIHL